MGQGVPMKSMLALSLLALIACSNPASQDQSQRNGTRFPGSRATFQGDMLMSWPFPVRQWFVESAIEGYKAGYDDGCRDMKANLKGRQPGGPEPSTTLCPNREKFDHQAIFYAGQMTDFYTKYPEDRDLPIAYLIAMLLDPKFKSLDDIHQWLKNPDKR